jgi:hypothetical protein
MRWVGHVVHIGETRKVHNFSRKPEDTRAVIAQSAQR